MGGASKLLMLLSTPFPRFCPRPSALRLARISTAASSHRRLPSSASRSHRQLIRVRAASEPLHTQAVSREHFGDPSQNLRSSHPWPEWSKLVQHLASGGFYDRRGPLDEDDAFSAYEELPEEFVKSAEACLSFARDRPDALRLLSKKDIEIIVENGSPFLFKNGGNSTRRMKAFLSGDESNASQTERAKTVDAVRYLLSYVYSRVDSYDDSLKAGELVETSARSLLNELVNVIGVSREPNFLESTPRQHPVRQQQFSRPPGQNVEIKRGDWICLKCSFMNFARNMRCLECDEARPKRQLTGGEWECPQCDFFNYPRNMSCLRCDCKRPANVPQSTVTSGASLGYGSNSNVGQILSGTHADKSEIERKLATNDEKAERWFSKLSQLDDSSDLSNAIADEDFPEIMPLQKGVNRFVVSTRKTPLERRLADAQHRRNVGSDGLGDRNDSQSWDSSRTGSDKSTELSISQSLDRILGRTSGTKTQSAGGEADSGAGSRFAGQRRESDYVPFVPLPPDMFSKPPTSSDQPSDKANTASLKAGQLDPLSMHSPIGVSGDAVSSEKVESSTESKKEKEASDASERWYKKVQELDGVTDLASAISDEDFPEIMPMRKGENRFVISKKKDRSLTSPQYKRQMAMERGNNSNFVPFVPFPPDYFAKKDKQAETGSSNKDAATGVSMPTEKAHRMPEESKAKDSSLGATGDTLQQPKSGTATYSSYPEFSGKSLNESKVDSAFGVNKPNSTQPPSNTWTSSKEGWSSEISQNNGAFGSSASGSSPQSGTSQNGRESWNRGYSGKSLEGSAVKETDPLDMSEEAKAERWFRRVAQIKDISELSQIPDEDFPEIMPMRKGVNRFVVSKRKTPLERRLTSPQYRRNLPIVNSDPEKDTSS